jgi:chromosomal replication initiation ATPase DnaA
LASPSYLPKTESQRRVSLQQIDSVVVARLGATRGLGKSQPACFNRQIAMYLASQVGRWSTTVIGRFYGGRDHLTQNPKTEPSETGVL